MFSFANDTQAGHTGILYFYRLLWIQNISNPRSSWEYRHIPNRYLEPVSPSPRDCLGPRWNHVVYFFPQVRKLVCKKPPVLVSRDVRHFTWMPHLPKSSNGTTHSSLFLGQGMGSEQTSSHSYTHWWECVPLTSVNFGPGSTTKHSRGHPASS